MTARTRTTRIVSKLRDAIVDMHRGAEARFMYDRELDPYRGEYRH